MALIKCPECGQDVSNESEKCVHCGFPLNKDDMIVCFNCGFMNRAGSAFCSSCGSSLIPGYKEPTRTQTDDRPAQKTTRKKKPNRTPLYVILGMLIAILGMVILAYAALKSGKYEVMVNSSSESLETESEISDLDALGSVSVKKELFNVKLTIPADYVGDSTQEDLTAEAKEKGYKSVTLNEDGSATYVMTKSQHNKMMEDISNNIKNSLSDLIESEDYPNFTSIQTNDDFTEFTITTKSTELDMDESFSTMVFYTYGGMYGIFNGSDVDNVHVDFVNAASGEIISSSDSKDMEDKE